MQIERVTGRPQQRLLDALPLPDHMEILWGDFLHLHSRRGSTGFGPARITDMQIDAWQRNRRVRLEQWQLDAIEAADDAYMASLPKPKTKTQ